MRGEAVIQNPKDLFPHIIATDPMMIAVLQQAVELARSELDLMIVGESGVGKELLARSLHQLSQRSKNPFVAVSLPAFSDTVFESELFGHERGAFTGAYRRHIGCFERAHGGTLFLDEIGHLPLPLQSKLLRALEEKAFNRVGGESLTRADVRILAATDQNLIELVKQGRFEKALYFRFRSTIHIPPLRERPADIPVLIEHYFKAYNRKYAKNLAGISPEALAYLERHPWPGNVRQLASVLEQAIVQIPPTQRVLDANDFKPLLRAWEGTTADLLRNCEWTELDSFTLDQIHALVIRRRLERFKGNKTRAAESLGISRETLRHWCAKYGLES